MSQIFFSWLQLTGWFALEIILLVLVTAQLQRSMKSSAWRRTLSHAGLVSLLLLTTFEFTGLSHNLTEWVRRSVQAAPMSSVVMDKKISPNSLDEPANTTPINQNELLRPPSQSIASPITVVQPPAPSTSTVRRETSSLIPNKSSLAAPAYQDLLMGATILIWMIGAIIVLGRLLLSTIVLEIFRSRRREIDDLVLRNLVQCLSRRLGIRRTIRLMESARIQGPVAFGIFRPTIGLPDQFATRFTPAQQEVMLAHELAHLAGHDSAWYLLADILTAALWWHPLVWWSRRRLHTETEQAADEASLLLANGPEVLAECLVEIGARLTRGKSFPQLGVEGTGFRSGLGRRVERLVKLHGADWQPPPPLRTALARTIGPITLVTATILCSAWVMPQALTQGENMQTMTQSWKKPLAAIALLASLNQAYPQAAVPPPRPEEPLSVEAKPDAVPVIEPVPLAQATTPLAENPTVPAPTPVPLASRVARPAVLPSRAAKPAPLSREQEMVEQKLTFIILDEVKYDNLPLSEVINNLVERTAANERFKNGRINFVLDRDQPQTSGAIDPATGLPVSGDPVDLASLTVKIHPALKNVRLKDVLDVITKTSEVPIKYSIEDYGVLFSLDSERRSPQPPSFTRAEPIQVRTFKMNTNTFFTGLERTFKISESGVTPENTTHALVSLLDRLGIHRNGESQQIYYNDVTGIVMMRGTAPDLDVMAAALETLGSEPTSPPKTASRP